jgi:hypothetical protein
MHDLIFQVTFPPATFTLPLFGSRPFFCPAIWSGGLLFPRSLHFTPLVSLSHSTPWMLFQVLFLAFRLSDPPINRFCHLGAATIHGVCDLRFRGSGVSSLVWFSLPMSRDVCGLTNMVCTSPIYLPVPFPGHLPVLVFNALRTSLPGVVRFIVGVCIRCCHRPRPRCTFQFFAVVASLPVWT